jgi:class 3 adenylate cyclase
MTQDEIIEMARQAGFVITYIGDPIGTNYSMIEAFAKLVAAKEREACALRAEDFLTEPEPDWDGDFWNQAVERVAMAIRARGEA